MADKPATPVGPSAKEASLFYSILSNFKDKNIASAVDWDAVAEDTGYNSGSTARVRYNQIRRNLEKEKQTASGDEKSPAKPKTPVKGKNPRADKTSKVTKTKKEPAAKKAPAKKTQKGKKEVAMKEEDESKEDDFADAPEEATEAHEDDDEEK